MAHPLILAALLVALAASGHALCGRWMGAARSGLERACGGIVLALGGCLAVVQGLSLVHAIAPLPFAVAAQSLVVLGFVAAGARGRARLFADVVAARDALRAPDLASLAPLTVALVSLGLAITATSLLVPWAWDALGYHLPIVHDALVTGSLRVVPTHIPYVNAYPRLVDLFFVAFRLGLPDDTWIELAQVPFALGGVFAIAALARRAQVPAGRALAVASLFLAVPVCALQLCANYVDVAFASLALLSAVFVSGRVDAIGAALAGVSLGMLFGSKPSAPPVVALLGLFFLVRAVRARRVPLALAAGAVALVIGGSKYVENTVAHGNPLWPVTLGPLPGDVPAQQLVELGVPAADLAFPWPMRVVRSWFAWDREPVYDMRIGGFGPLFGLGVLPLALVALRTVRGRRLGLVVLVVCVATLATPGAFWPRYTLALPGVLLALVAAGLDRSKLRPLALVWLGALGALGLVWALPGYTHHGPPLSAFLSSPTAPEVASFGVDLREDLWRDARGRVGTGEAFGYDRGFGLPGQLWRADGLGRVAYLPDAGRKSREELDAWLRQERVRVVALGDAPLGAKPLADADPARFTPLFRCPQDPCTVFEVRTSGVR